MEYSQLAIEYGWAERSVQFTWQYRATGRPSCSCRRQAPHHQSPVRDSRRTTSTPGRPGSRRRWRCVGTRRRRRPSPRCCASWRCDVRWSAATQSADAPASTSDRRAAPSPSRGSPSTCERLAGTRVAVAATPAARRSATPARWVVEDVGRERRRTATRPVATSCVFPEADCAEGWPAAAAELCRMTSETWRRRFRRKTGHASLNRRPYTGLRPTKFHQHARQIPYTVDHSSPHPRRLIVLFSEVARHNRPTDHTKLNPTSNEEKL